MPAESSAPGSSVPIRRVRTGLDPTAGVVLDSAGNLYGTTEAGGTAGVGVVFELSTTGQLTVLHSFSGADGSGPVGVTLSPGGNLYGATVGGGKNGGGVVFKITP